MLLLLHFQMLLWFIFLMSRVTAAWMITSRLDYGSATLAGLPKQLTDRLQSVQNAAARLIFKACRQDRVQPLLRRLHWLWVPERISFRLAVLVYRCLNGSASDYLASDLQRVSHLNARQRLRSSTTSALVAPCTCLLYTSPSPRD